MNNNDSLNIELMKIFTELQCILSLNEIITLKSIDKSDLCLYHFGLGLWLRNTILKKIQGLLNF